MQRRYTSLVAAGIVTALTLTLSGCGAGQGNRVTLKLVAADYGDGTGPGSRQYWDQLTRAFEKKHPGIKVEVDVYNWKDVDKKVADLVRKGHAPDLAQSGSYADYAAQGQLYSADELLSIPVQAGLQPTLAEAGEVGRVQYGIPFAASTRRLFYNKKLFAQAGIAKAPKTWDDVAEDAELLKKQGVKRPYALPLGPEEPQAESLNWMLGGGGGYTDDIGKYAIDSPANVKTFEWLRDELVDKGLTGGDPATLNRADAFAGFADGQVGMLNGHPALIKQAEANGIDYGTADLPGKDGPSASTLGVSDWMMAFKHNGHRTQVGKFLDFVYDDTNVLNFSHDFGLLPVTISAAQKMAGDHRFGTLQDFVGPLRDAQFYPANKTSWPEVAKALKSEMGTAVDPKGDPSSILSDLQNTAEAADTAGG
ncbi:extracellular solute-binding protein [Streptomyces sp. NPDC059080]|uniref:extracellular solute-binding protein n=1 Tax=Streptomyces sp. NPDC059080 TaxID=3346718 RepID=UPI0036CCAC55